MANFCCYVIGCTIAVAVENVKALAGAGGGTRVAFGALQTWGVAFGAGVRSAAGGLHSEPLPPRPAFGAVVRNLRS